LKTNRPEVPFASYDDPIIDAAIQQRREYFAAKSDHLYRVEIFYVIVLEGARSIVQQNCLQRAALREQHRCSREQMRKEEP
jgi:hypothetical protein